MRFSPVIDALLCFTTWMSMAHATSGPVASCCLQWSNTLSRVPLERIVDYTNQSEGLCPITAVVFQTKRGRRICSDPNSNWAEKAIRKVDKEKEKKALQEKGLNEESTSDIPPAVSTAPTNARQKECRNGRRRQRKKSRRGRKVQRKRV
ncbi:C-C motif chemokine 4-like isoform X1 [Sander lucioperca]|uniref:Monocyte chemotactic protein 1B-like n=1 Tax=Sander lucioperca TaxID=283035 RepID=A0A8D0D5I3_SANLU|nr:C-C motif chemokine 4-like isoform X1 [Sander lucioperca]XP_035861159.1 C-C motif chemokine 4-like isoform X1 [Sander lucioperca]